MKSSLSRATVVCLCAVLLSGAVSAQQQKRLITEKDLFQFTWIGDPQISPDGSQVAFVRITVNEKKDGYNTAIWSVSSASGDLRQLTAGPGDTSPQWSPDGKLLAFIRTTEKDGKKQPPQIFILPASGGEAWQLTKLPKGASRPAWAPDGKTLAFNSITNSQDLLQDACKSGKEKDKSKCPPADQRQSDVHVVTRAVFRINGVGYLDFSHPNHIWSIAVPPNPQELPQPKQLTTGDFSEQDIEWAPDGSKIYFVSTRDLEPYYHPQQNAVYSVPAAGGEISEVTRLPGGTLRSIALSRDGKRMAFLGTLSEPAQSFTQPELWVVDLVQGAAPRNLTKDYDWEVGGGILGDQEPPRGAGGSQPIWTPDGKALITVVAKQGRANLERVDAENGQVTPVTTGDRAIEGYAATPDGSRVVAEVSTPTILNDLYLVEAAGSRPKRLTDINQKLFSQLNLSPPEEIGIPASTASASRAGCRSRQTSTRTRNTP